MRTYFPKQGDIEPKWFIIDAEGKVLGRLSTEIARIISGKSKPTYTPFLDTGDSVVAITGGTGAYRNARGWMDLKYHNPAGTAFDFVFHLIG